MPIHKKKEKRYLIPFESLKEKLSVFISVGVIFGMIFAGWGWMENRYAQKKVELKLDYLKYTIQNDLNDTKIKKAMERAPKGIENADDSTKIYLEDLMKKKVDFEKKIECLEKMGVGL